MAFERYSELRCFYLNLPFEQPTKALLSQRFDLVVFDTTFLSSRWTASYFRELCEIARPLRELAEVAVMLPQDEFLHADLLCAFADDFDIDYIFSVAPESEWPKIYDSVDRERTPISRVLTGYLDPSAVDRIDATVAGQGKRQVKIGYRAWPNAPWLGRHGRLKPEVGRRVREAAERRGMPVDISTDASDRIYGDAWYEFLASCEYTIGVEGGASILDRDGSLFERTEAFTSAHPEATFEEVEAACFPGRDGEVDLVASGPRHLEACATRTAQILVEGDYSGVLEAGRHYIPLRADYSNLAEVLDAVENDELRAAITTAAYDDIVASGRYSYESFVQQVETVALGDVARAVPSRAASRSVSLHDAERKRTHAREIRRRERRVKRGAFVGRLHRWKQRISSQPPVE